MPVTVVPSSQQSAKKKSTSSRKRRQNQNEEVHELASLVPLSSSQLSGLIPSNGGKPQTISVLRLTTTFLKLQSFIKDASPLNSIGCEQVSNDGLNLGRMEEAIDGFLIVLDKDANILYVSETIAGHVGLIQQDVIGQNFADITHPEFVTEIRDSLKPSILLPMSVSDDVTISQYRQFFVRIVPNVAYSTSPSNSVVLVRGNLKVKLSPSNITTKDELEFVEPSVIGFVGECRVVEMAASILEISIPHSSFVITRSLDMQRVISVEASVRDVVGYDPDVLLTPDLNVVDFLHPSDQDVIITLRKYLLQNGHVVSPQFRFLTRSGEWVWLQLEGKLCSNFWEIRIRALGQWGGKLKYIEQKELYSSETDKDACHENNPVPKLASAGLSKYRPEDGAKPIIDSLKNTRMPESVLEPMLHGRSVAMNDLSKLVKQMNNSPGSGATSLQQHLQQPATSSKLSPPGIAVSAYAGSPSKSSIDTLSCHASTSSTISDQSKSPVNNSVGSECPPKALAAAEPVSIAQSQFSQQLLEESCHSILTVPNPMEQGGVQSPMMSGSTSTCSIGSSSPASSAMMLSPAQQDFVPSPEQFLDITRPVHEMCPSLYSSATTSTGPICDSPSDNMIHTVPQSADSSTSSVPFPYSQTPNFIPQPPSNTDFNPQLCSDFDFLSSTSAQTFLNFDTAPAYLDVSIESTCVPTSQTLNFDSSNLALNDANDSLMQQIVDDIMMMDESNFNPTGSVSDYSMNNTDMDSTISCNSSHFQTTTSSPAQNLFSHPNVGQYCPSMLVPNVVDQAGGTSADFLLNSHSNATNTPPSVSSSLDVHDISQQFM